MKKLYFAITLFMCFMAIAIPTLCLIKHQAIWLGFGLSVLALLAGKLYYDLYRSAQT
jgi:hypothetical protein